MSKSRIQHFHAQELMGTLKMRGPFLKNRCIFSKSSVSVERSIHRAFYLILVFSSFHCFWTQEGGPNQE